MSQRRLFLRCWHSLEYLRYDSSPAKHYQLHYALLQYLCLHISSDFFQDALSQKFPLFSPFPIFPSHVCICMDPCSFYRYRTLFVSQETGKNLGRCKNKSKIRIRNYYFFFFIIFFFFYFFVCLSNSHFLQRPVY